MKIVIPGGSGQVGTILARAFHAGGDDVVVLSRRPAVRPWRVAVGRCQLGAWEDEIDGCDVVINLAGRSVNCRYNAANRREILESRVRSTRVVGEAIARAAHPPRVWLQASTATIYAPPLRRRRTTSARASSAATKPDAPATWRFSIDVARAWEQRLRRGRRPAARERWRCGRR